MRSLLRGAGRGGLALALAASVLLALAAPAAAGHVARPFVGFSAGTSTLGPPIADCPAGSMWYLEDHGAGTFAHLGRASTSLHQCAAANLETGQGWTTTNGSMTMVAANGDHLVLSYAMAFIATPLPVPKTATGHLDWTVVGGTGRFTTATGSGQALISVQYTPDLSGASTSLVWWGTITY